MKVEMSVLVGPGRADFLTEVFPPGTEITPGDTKLIWDSDQPVEVEAAKATFDKLRAKGYVAFKAEGKNGEKGARLNEWDPHAERIILVPKIAGGRRWC